MKFLNLLLTAFVLATICIGNVVNAQVTATIGTGTSSDYTYGVIYRSSSSSGFDYSRYHYVYTASELSAAGISPGASISELKWYLNSTSLMSGTGNATLKIYIKNSSASIATNNTWANLIAGSTQVFNGIYNTTNNFPGVVGWMPFTLSSAFVYTGGSLEISVDWDCSAITGNPTTGAFNWQYSTASGIRSTYVNNNVLPASTTTTSANRPNIQIVHTASACPGPVGLMVTSLTTTSANFSWTAVGAATGYNWVLVAAGAGSGGTPVASGSTAGPTASATGLSPNTAYDFYVQSDCGGGTLSLFGGPLSIYTNYCTVVSTSNASYFDAFTTTGGSTNISNTSSGYATNGYQDATSMVVSKFAGASVNFSTTLVGTTVGVNIWVDWNNDLIFNDVTEKVYASGAYVSTASGTITVPGGTPIGNYRMRIRCDFNATNPVACGASGSGRNETEDYTFAVVAAPSCVPPTTLTATNITTTSANLGWTSTASNWQIQYGAQGFALGTGTMAFTSSNPHNLTGLTPNTSYGYYVRAICGVGDTSTWAGPFTFYTGYCTVVSTSNASYFDAFTTTGGFLNISNTSSGYATNGYQDASAMTVSQVAGGNVNFATTLVGTTVGVNIWIDWNNDLIFDNVTEKVYATGAYVSTASGTITVPGGTPLGNYRMRIRCDYNATNPNPCGASGSGRNETEDYTFAVVNPPSCVPPTTLTATAITSSGANLGWISAASNWQVEYGAQGFALGTGTTAFTSSNPHSISGLNANTSYGFYVRAICAVGDTSNWAGPFTFTTLCATYNAPYFQPFATPSIPTCWSQGGITPWEYGSITGTTPAGFADYGANTVADHSPGGGGTFIGMDGSDNTNGEVSTLTSPMVNISTLTNPQVSYWVFSNNINDAAQNRLYVEIFSGGVWTAIDSVQANLGASWVEFVTDLSSFASPVQIRFTVTGVANGGSTYYNDILIDDVLFDEAPSCIAPSFLTTANLTSTSIDFGWTANGTTNWQIEYGTTGFTVGTGTTIYTTNNPHNITGLTANTSYDLYVRGICGPNDTSAWVGPVTIYTGSCIPNPSSVDGDGITNVTMGSINNTTVAEVGNYGDYTAQSTTVGIGATLPIDITLSTGYIYNLWAWVDWNGDLDFDDANEEYYLGESTDLDPTTFSGSIVIPANAAVGSYRIRIGGADSGLGSTSPSDPCYTGAYGAFEDYTLNVICIAATGTDTKAACGSFIWIDGNTYTANNTTATHTITAGAANGCDSIVTLNLTINTPTTGTDVQVACGSFTWIDGNTYTANNTTATHTVTGSNGCDSVVTLNLTINTPTTGTDVQVACGSFTWIDGNTYTASNNTATHTVTGSNGCDSVVTLNLTINAIATGTDTQVACGSFVWIDGNTYTANNTTATHTIIGGAANGCDSVVTLNLTINAPAAGTDTQVACGSFVWIDGNTYTANNTTATHTITGGAANGCDSVVTLNLTITTVDASVTDMGMSLMANATGATYQWVDCNNGNAAILGETSQTFIPVANGDYAVEVTVNGCTETSTCFNVTGVNVKAVNGNIALNLYPNPTENQVILDFGTAVQDATVRLIAIDGRLLEQFINVNGNQFTLSLEAYPAAMYFLEVTTKDAQTVMMKVSKL